MSKPNRGKDFEAQIRDGLDCSADTIYIRLFDQMSGFKGVANPCDFVAYRNPIIYFIECKCCYGNTLGFANISAFQWRSLTEFAQTYGVVAGYIIWFIDHDLTVFVEARDVDNWLKIGKKSIHINDLKNNTLKHIELLGRKRKVFFDYEMNSLFDIIEHQFKEYIE